MFGNRREGKNIVTENLCLAILNISNEENEEQCLLTITEGGPT